MTLTNDFHNTTVTVRLTRQEMLQIEDEADGMYGRDAEKRALRRMRAVWKKLCGMRDCECGNAWGER